MARKATKMTPNSNHKPHARFTGDMPLGLARSQCFVWTKKRWVGLNIYTAVTLVKDLEDALDSESTVDGEPDFPGEAEVERVETFCVRVKPYFGERLSRPARMRLCAEYARNIIAALNGHLDHVILRGQSHFFPALAPASKTKVA